MNTTSTPAVNQSALHYGLPEYLTTSQAAYVSGHTIKYLQKVRYAKTGRGRPPMIAEPNGGKSRCWYPATAFLAWLGRNGDQAMSNQFGDPGMARLQTAFERYLELREAHQ